MKRFSKKARILASLAFCVFGSIFAFINTRGASALGSATYAISGADSVYAGETITLQFSVDAGGSTIKALGAAHTDASGCLELTAISAVSADSARGGRSMKMTKDTPFSGSLVLATATYTAASSPCTAVITMGGGGTDSITYGDNSSDSGPTASKTVNVINREPEPEPEKSSDNQITGLSSNPGTVSGSGTEYTVSGVPSDTSSVTLTPSLPAGASVDGGSPITCNLTGDSTTCSFTVTAENGDKKNYTVTVNREPKKEEDTPKEDDTPKDDPSLKSISADNNIISGFNPDVTSYTINVGTDVTGMNFTAVANDPSTTYTISGANDWKVGTNVVSVTATAPSGAQRVYTINVVRAQAAKKPTTKSSNNYLEKLVSHNGALSPDFDKNKTTYYVKVPRDVTSLNLSAIAEDDKAKVEIIGNSGFEIGKTSTVYVKVTAENGEQRIYTINVTRADVEAKTDLETLEVDGHEISPKFDKNIDKYSLTVPYGVDEINISAVPADKDSKVTIIGNKNLAVGNNTVLVKVTDKNGFSHVYELNVRRQEEPTILGIRRGMWWIFPVLLILIPLLLLLILFLLGRRRRERETNAPAQTIEFAPAFNFGSRVGTDDDTVMPYGVNNQAENVPATTLAQPQHKAIIAGAHIDDEEEDSLDDEEIDGKGDTFYLDRPTTTATVTPIAASAAGAKAPIMAGAEAMGAANSDDIERRIEERADMIARSREVDRIRKEAIDAETTEKEAAYDLYDDVVTKDELIDAIEDVRENHDSTKLNLLLKQEELNRKKEEMRRIEAAKAAHRKIVAAKKQQEEYWG